MNTFFYYATCQTGAEKALKNEVLIEHPKLKFAFSRPGFITFKYESSNNKDIAPEASVFTRLWGKVLGQTKKPEEIGALVAQIPKGAIVHLFERDLFVPGDEPNKFVDGATIENIWNSLPEELRNKYLVNTKPKEGAEVYDLIWVDDFHVFLGIHIHTPYLFPDPGNKAKIALPKEAPSRAYLKLEEAIYIFKPEFKKGMTVLEVGCSPGGASIAMLKRGMSVVGIDPKKMAPNLYTEQGFFHIQKPAIAVTGIELRDVNPDWIVMDMNIAPLEAIDELAYILSLLRKNHGRRMNLKGAMLTFKLNDWKFAGSIPLYLKRVAEMGFGGLGAAQMSLNRQEIFVMAREFSFQ